MVNEYRDDAPILSYEQVAEACEQGPVGARFFSLALGFRNWLVLDDDSAMPEGAGIYPFVIRRVWDDANAVDVLIASRSHPTGILARFDADELALRIEAS